MPANQSTKTERDRDFRELDSSISSNLTEREGKKERKRRTERERENGRSLFSRGKSLVWNRGKKKETKKEGKEINREGNGSTTVN